MTTAMFCTIGVQLTTDIQVLGANSDNEMRDVIVPFLFLHQVVWCTVERSTLIFWPADTSLQTSRRGNIVNNRN